MNRPILRACYRSSFTSGAYPATQTLFSTPRFLTPLRAVPVPRNHRQLPQSRRTMTTTTTNNHQSASAPRDPRPIFFFDIDNCLYSRECNIHDEMQKLINAFFIKHLSLSTEDAHHLHMKYYKEYGLAIEGLTRHHKIDPLAFNREVDDALPLDEILKPDPQLRRLLEDIDRSQVRLWLLTNAYVTHAKRVVRLLEVDDLFEGVTYCDYSQTPLVCKPSQVMYDKAEREAGASSSGECYFVDDSGSNCKHAAERGWAVAHLVEPGVPAPPEPASQFQISSLEELRTCFPHLFKSRS